MAHVTLFQATAKLVQCAQANSNTMTINATSDVKGKHWICQMNKTSLKANFCHNYCRHTKLVWSFEVSQYWKRQLTIYPEPHMTTWLNVSKWSHNLKRTNCVRINIVSKRSKQMSSRTISPTSIGIYILIPFENFWQSIQCTRPTEPVNYKATVNMQQSAIYSNLR